MKLDRQGPPSGRLVYRWRFDREHPFAAARLSYDQEGRLVSVDYELARRTGEDDSSDSSTPSD